MSCCIRDEFLQRSEHKFTGKERGAKSDSTTLGLGTTARTWADGCRPIRPTGASISIIRRRGITTHMLRTIHFRILTLMVSASPSYSGAPNYMSPAINPMQLTGGNGANTNLNHNGGGGMGILDWAGRSSTFDPMATSYRYSDHSPTTMSNWLTLWTSLTV